MGIEFRQSFHGLPARTFSLQHDPVASHNPNLITGSSPGIQQIIGSHIAFRHEGKGRFTFPVGDISPVTKNPNMSRTTPNRVQIYVG